MINGGIFIRYKPSDLDSPNGGEDIRNPNERIAKEMKFRVSQEVWLLILSIHAVVVLLGTFESRGPAGSDRYLRAFRFRPQWGFL
jgi:hypothetical protein